MDDIQSQISRIMSDPEAMKQVQSLGEILGISQNQKPPEPKPPEPVKDISSLLGSDTLSGITKLMPVLSSIKQEDETTRLLLALKPFLSEDKRRKLEEAKKMLQFLKVLPLLKNGGLF